MVNKPPGKFQFDLLAFLTQRDGLTVRDIQEGFGKPRGYVRGTIVKSMDRLLKRGLVERELVEGNFVYRTKQGKDDLDRQLVESFVKDRLGGRLGPIASFLSESKDLDPNELKLLRELLDQMEP